MAFLTKDDFLSIIRENVLDDITEFNDDKITTGIEEAVSVMEGYLASRYDTDAIFLATGEDRNKSIVMYCKDIVLYNLHSNISPRKIPKLRYDRYNAAMDWLEKVSDCKINPSGLPKIAGGAKDYVQFGGNTRRDNPT